MSKQSKKSAKRLRRRAVAVLRRARSSARLELAAAEAAAAEIREQARAAAEAECAELRAEAHLESAQIRTDARNDARDESTRILEQAGGHADAVADERRAVSDAEARAVVAEGELQAARALAEAEARAQELRDAARTEREQHPGRAPAVERARLIDEAHAEAARIRAASLDEVATFARRLDAERREIVEPGTRRGGEDRRRRASRGRDAGQVRAEADAKALAEVKAAAPVDVPVDVTPAPPVDVTPAPPVVDATADADIAAANPSVNPDAHAVRTVEPPTVSWRPPAPASTNGNGPANGTMRLRATKPTDSVLADAAAKGQAPKRKRRRLFSPLALTRRRTGQSRSTYRRVTGAGSSSIASLISIRPSPVRVAISFITASRSSASSS